MFSEVGYDRATVRMLSDRLGIKSGSLYSHISSKEEVLYWVIEDVAEEFTSRGRGAVKEADRPDEQVRSLCRSHMQVMRAKHLKVRVYFEEWRKLDDDHQRSIIELRDEYENLLVSSIRAGVEAGHFSCEPAFPARLLLSALNSTAGWYSQDGRLSPEEIADSIVEIFFDGMRPR